MRLIILYTRLMHGSPETSLYLQACTSLAPPIPHQVPDFTSLISDEVEAQRFLDATAADLPKPPKASSAQERRAPIGKVVLFTNKAEVPGIYKALAMHFTGKSRMLFAWSTATMDGPAYALMQKMNVSFWLRSRVQLSLWVW